MKKLFTFTLTVFLSFVCSQTLLAQLTANRDGKLDSSFGTNGYSLIQTGDPVSAGVSDMAMTPDGRILVLSFVTGVVPALTRFLPDGTLDITFDQDGYRVLTELNRLYPLTIAVQPDGKIVLAGNSSTSSNGAWVVDSVVIRLNSDTTLDHTFGNGGIVTRDFSLPGELSHDRFLGLSIRQNGDIVAAGLADRFSAAGHTRTYATLVRLKPDGSVDQSFGDAGLSLVPVGNGQSSGYFETIDALRFKPLRTGGFGLTSSRRVYASETSEEYMNYTTLLRFTDDGLLDPSFSADGQLSYSTGLYSNRVQGLAETSDGKLMVLSTENLLRRFESNGEPDLSFGNNGQVTLEPNWGTFEMRLTNDEKILVIGVGRDALSGPPSQFFAIARRYHNDGSSDIKFARNGTRTFLIGASYSEFQRLEFQSNGNYLLLGSYQDASSTKPFISRIIGSRKIPFGGN